LLTTADRTDINVAPGSVVVVGTRNGLVTGVERTTDGWLLRSPRYRAARSRVGTQRPRFDIMVSEHD
jgi:hypothetical protein